MTGEGTGECYLNLGSGEQRLLFLRNDPDVEDSRKDEDEAGGRCGSWRGKRRTGKKEMIEIVQNKTWNI